MFESLTQRLDTVFDRLRGKGKISEKDVEDAMREVRQALLEADVNFRLVKEFVKKVQERAVGAEVLQSLSPAQQVIAIVHEELVAMLGGGDGEASKTQIAFAPAPPTVLMLAGLQGSGKTTTRRQARPLPAAARPLAHARRRGRAAPRRRAAVAACSASRLHMPVYSEDGGRPPRICERSLDAARAAELRHRDPRHRRPPAH